MNAAGSKYSAVHSHRLFAKHAQVVVHISDEQAPINIFIPKMQHLLGFLRKLNRAATRLGYAGRLLWLK
jgi:hypothetical protein